MKKPAFVLFVLGTCLLLSGTGLYAADENQKKASQLLGKHYYASAAALLRGASPAADPTAENALLLARVYAQNARLHRALQRSSLDIGVTYLKKLATQSGRERSRFVSLYYAEYLLASGKKREGLVQLRRFIGQNKQEPVYRELARAQLTPAAPDLSKHLHPLVRSQLAAAMSSTPDQKSAAVVQTDLALAELSRANPLLPVRAVSNALGVYARGAQSAKAFAVFEAADLSQPSYEETIGAAKVLRFYDASLLGNLAELYQAEAERLLQRAKADSRLKPLAAYFLVELYLDAGQFAKATTMSQELLASKDLPPVYRERLDIMMAVLEIHGNQATRGNATLNTLGKKYEQDPLLLGEVLMACVQHKAKCPAVISAARNLAASNQGEKFRSLHFAVGEHYAHEGKPDRALLELETARDKSNKNRIDNNDPLLLVRLADLYFANKSFSESLEIYFEMSREFPALRQLQEAAQGVYSTEYRSAGDAKIF